MVAAALVRRLRGGRWPCGTSWPGTVSPVNDDARLAGSVVNFFVDLS